MRAGTANRVSLALLLGGGRGREADALRFSTGNCESGICRTKTIVGTSPPNTTCTTDDFCNTGEPSLGALADGSRLSSLARR